MLESKTEIMPLHPDCLAQLKLRQPPFDAVPNEEFLYSDPLLESLIETAIRALTAPGAIVILAGVDGSGRSIQLMRLLGALGDHFELIAFRGRANISFSAVDATIRNHLRSIGLNHPARALKELLVERSRAGFALVLALDDAHLLGMEIIERLLRMRAEILEANGQGLRLILVGDPSLNRSRLPLPDPADENQIVRLNLRPFNLEQAGAYLRHRLRVAGIEDPETFLTSGDIAVLQTSSKGVAAALNANANAWLTRRCRSANGFRQAIAGKLGQLASPASASQARVHPDAAPQTSAATQHPSEPAPMHPEGILDLEGDDDVFQPTDPELSRFLVQEDARLETSDFERVLRQIRNNQLLPDAQPTPKSRPPPERKPESPGNHAATRYWNRPWFIPAILAIVVVSILVPVVLQLEGYAPGRAIEAPEQPDVTPVIERAQPSAPDQARVTEAAVAPVAEPAPKPISLPALEETSQLRQPRPKSASPSEMTASPGVINPKPEPSPAPEIELKPASESVTAKVSADLTADQDWLLRQDPGRFTIQLVAARNLSIATEFVVAHKLDGIHFIQTRSFMVALVGSYPNRVEAENASRALPPAVRANGPWIRTLGSVLESQR
jgi:DamX protein